MALLLLIPCVLAPSNTTVIVIMKTYCVYVWWFRTYRSPGPRAARSCRRQWWRGSDPTDGTPPGRPGPACGPLEKPSELHYNIYFYIKYAVVFCTAAEPTAETQTARNVCELLSFYQKPTWRSSRGVHSRHTHRRPWCTSLTCPRSPWALRSCLPLHC